MSESNTPANVGLMEGLGAWLPIETAPKNGLILLAVEGAAGERRTFAAEASHEGGGWVWMFTTGWGGWKRLHGAWAPIFWQPLPQTPNLNSTTAPSYNSRVVLASR